jgi:hypothetical protein
MAAGLALDHVQGVAERTEQLSQSYLRHLQRIAGERSAVGRRIKRSTRPVGIDWSRRSHIRAVGRTDRLLLIVKTHDEITGPNARAPIYDSAFTSLGVAAKPRHKICRTRRSLQSIADCLKQRITDRMTERIVDHLEAIEARIAGAPTRGTRGHAGDRS